MTLPHGKTYFHRPSGHTSNGRLVIDFIGLTLISLPQELGLPLVPPYLPSYSNNNSKGFEHDVNFAVIGATALNDELFRGLGYKAGGVEPLSWQLDLFHEWLSNNTSSVQQDNILSNKSLFLIGEIGVNDYNIMLSELQESNINRLRTYVTSVVGTIGSAVNDLIQTGAKNIMVAGLFPMGCMPFYNTIFNGAIDVQNGCNIDLNEFAKYHNLLLQQKLRQLFELHPQVKIFYADYYEPLMQIYNFPRRRVQSPKEVIVKCFSTLKMGE
ncbi:GDSL esterase/lipase [Canna indica]|uniref:GDSL esterase/lipase n=1 Tax=Canna indica TaxID=4628 RepID=A0AAQ3QBP3_9LILI|nr:GDSL esterase/lipase [Canna indica]